MTTSVSTVANASPKMTAAVSGCQNSAPPEILRSSGKQPADRGNRGQQHGAKAVDPRFEDCFTERQASLSSLIGKIDQYNGIVDDNARKADQADERCQAERKAARHMPSTTPMKLAAR